VHFDRRSHDLPRDVIQFRLSRSNLPSYARHGHTVFPVLPVVSRFSS
jgi:hypothetical protein